MANRSRSATTPLDGLETFSRVGHLGCNTAGPSVAHASRVGLLRSYTKPYLPIADQIALLRSRGMTIEDEGKAEEYLRRIGYYRLSAYWHPMRVRDAASNKVLDDFVQGTTFKEVTDLYTFDGRLRLLALDALERLEVSLRTEVALTLGKHDPCAHRETRFLDQKFTRAKGGKPSRHREWVQRLDERATYAKDQFAEHFRKTYPNDDMPIWIAVELLDFGPLSHLIGGMRFSDRQQIGRGYGGVDANQLASWTRALSFTRNVCAHHSRLWNRPLVNQPALPKGKVPSELAHIASVQGKATRFYAIASIMQFMLRCANPRTSWKDRFIAHIHTFPSSPRISLAAAGFHTGWESESLWQ